MKKYLLHSLPCTDVFMNWFISQHLDWDKVMAELGIDTATFNKLRRETLLALAVEMGFDLRQ